MALARLIDGMSDPAAYPHAVAKVDVRHTHISVVFLAGPFAYKIKKPVNLGFLDFSTLAKRRHFCEEEVRLNRRLAPHVYLGVVPLTRTASGVKVAGEGEAIEWAVKMERLPEEATLEKQLQHGSVGFEIIQELARKVASFHARAEASEDIAAFGRFNVVSNNARENFAQVAPLIGMTIRPTVFNRLRSLTERSLTRLRPLIESRAERKLPRDTHGDLHLDHVYWFPDRKPPENVIIVDCIEFNERFRFADPIADMAFLVMDLAFHGRRELARAFFEEYIHCSGDAEGRELLPFYTAYRAAVRGKVEGFELREAEVPQSERVTALARARAHWLLALGELETPNRRPCLLLVGGLPGTGKSTLACDLASIANCRILRSDQVRKELAGIPPETLARSTFGTGLYAPAWTKKTYAECMRRAKSYLLDGERVIVDATFSKERRRRDFLEMAQRLAVPAVFLLCHAENDVVRRRLTQRHGDASDADWAVYQRAADCWEPAGARTQTVLRTIQTGEAAKHALAQVLCVLREMALFR